jgi:DnaJ like chaperone protein
MSWYGKIIGAVLGLIIGRGLLGAIVGLVIGHQFDRRAAGSAAAGGDPRALRDEFFRATFQVMGHVAKADGRVSEEEIEAARAVMRRYALGEEDVRRAIGLFTDGKRSDFPLEGVLGRLRTTAAARRDLLRLFVQIQLEAAVLGGGPNAPTRAVLARVCAALGVSAVEFAALEAMLRMQTGRPGAGTAGGHGAAQPPPSSRLEDAYRVLGVGRAATDREVKLAYRRLMSRNHPDKLVASGLPPPLIEAAHERTRQIIAAYDLVRESRGMK